VVLMLGAKFSGLPSEQYTKVLADTGESANKAGSAKAHSAVRFKGNLVNVVITEIVIVVTPGRLMLLTQRVVQIVQPDGKQAFGQPVL